MDIMELGAIGELVGGVAVIASLIYVGLQVRQGNQINRAESARAIVRDYNNFLYKLVDNVDIWRRGSVDFESLSGEEQSKLHWLLMSQFFVGLGDSIATPDRRDPLARFIDGAISRVLLGLPGFRSWWTTFKRAPEQVTPEYTTYLESLADQYDGRDPFEYAPWYVPDAANTERGK